MIRNLATKVIKFLVKINVSLVLLLVPASQVKKRILSPQDSVRLVIESKKSLIRWGDGETNLLAGVGLDFQNSNWALSKRLWKVLWSYSEKSPFLLALPNPAFQEISKLIRSRTWRFWWSSRFLFLIFYFLKWRNPGAMFPDSFLFREGGDIGKASWKPESLKSLIPADRPILFVSNANQIEKFKLEFGGERVSFIVIPDQNAFDQEKTIMAEIANALGKDSNSETIICFSAGPAAKSLILALSATNLCFDLGNFKLSA